ncbi:anti-sigma factor domain-containing protein [Methylobacterium sp. J-077]|uniref:anti-sigma factor n=1 Tax=Methylobacterium sp. J-077 TaxID=2836656 RepID=UPI001FBA07C2|nr:anti-sigma factor [Methylobacterium sp. J-077]MCJ2125982.1 anti-sigma factor [Methylobacterium sp. J-077]
MSGGPDDRAPDPGSDPDLRAAEYVLGTLDPGERAAMAGALATDTAVAARVRAWERRLSPLLHAIPAATPSPRVRAALLRALPAKPGGSPDLLANDPLAHDPLAHLRRQVRRWRIASAGAGLLAAGLALFVAFGSRPEPEGGRYLAVVQGGGALPALIVRVDTRTGTAQVRPVGAEAPAGRSLELWYVGAAGPKPLGLVGAAATRVTLPQGAAPDGVLAVSVEPPGGSPSGQPTGPVVYTGKLIAE